MQSVLLKIIKLRVILIGKKQFSLKSLFAYGEKGLHYLDLTADLCTYNRHGIVVGN